MQLENVGSLLCAIVAFIAYLNTVQSNFAFDDSFAVIYNGDVTSDSNPHWGFLVNDFWGQRISSEQSHKSWRPLTVLSFRMLRKAWAAVPEPWRQHVMARRSLTRLPYEEDEAGKRGLDPLLFHFSNVMLHALVSALVCRLSYFLLRRRWRPRSLLVCVRRSEKERGEKEVRGNTQHQQKQQQQQQQGTQVCQLPCRWASSYDGSAEKAVDRGLTYSEQAVASQNGLRRRRKPQPREIIAAETFRAPRSGGGESATMTTSLAALEGRSRWLQFHLPAWFSGMAFALHPVHTEAVAGVVGHAELLCAMLSIPAVMLYIDAAETAAAARARRRWTCGSVAAHWGIVVSALALSVAAALAKEIGITVLGCMLAADVLLVPVVVTGSSHEDNPTVRDVRPGASGAASTRGPAGAPSSAALGRRVLQLVLWAIVEEPKWTRMALLAAVGIGYVRLRSWVAVDQLVRIFRKVENPIAFSETPLERILSTGHLHARYAGLLFWPQHLSADWSFNCIPMVSSISDPRNALTAALYTALAAVLIAARPWEVLATWGDAAAVAAGQETAPCAPEAAAAAAAVSAATATAAVTDDAQRLWAARWRLLVVAGLLVGPFFPASNLVFYVGTFIGERLLYFPSIGFCLLVSELLSRVLMWAAGEDGNAAATSATPTAIVAQRPYAPQSAPETAGASKAILAPAANAETTSSNRDGTTNKESTRTKSEVPTSANAENAATMGDGPAAEGTAAAVPVRSHGPSQGRLGGGCAARAAVMCRTVTVVTYTAMIVVLVLCAVRTWKRNWDWSTEAALFESAGKVCPNSAKVQLNLGILQRRRGDQVAARHHFLRARTLEPGFCEPDYWMGVSLINSGDTASGIKELETALDCKYVALDALKSLNTIYNALHSNNPRDPQPVMRWGQLLLHPQVRQLAQGCDALERAALMEAQLGATKEVEKAVRLCEEALQQQQQQQQQQELLHKVNEKDTDAQDVASDGPIRDPRLLRRCLEARRPVYTAIAAAVSSGRLPKSPRVVTATYKYMKHLAALPHCRGPLLKTPLEGAAALAPAHLYMMHAVQSTDPEDPWLQAEWARTLKAVGRTQEASVHFSVAAMLLNAQVPRLRAEQVPSVRSLAATGRKPVGMAEVLEGIAIVLEDSARLRLANECELWKQVVETRRMLVAVVEAAAPSGLGSGRGTGGKEVAEYQAALRVAAEEMRRRQPPCA